MSFATVNVSITLFVQNGLPPLCIAAQNEIPAQINEFKMQTRD